MQEQTTRDIEYSNDSHIENIRRNYDTTSLGAIMARFQQAVSFDRQEVEA